MLGLLGASTLLLVLRTRRTEQRWRRGTVGAGPSAARPCLSALPSTQHRGESTTPTDAHTQGSYDPGLQSEAGFKASAVVSLPGFLTCKMRVTGRPSLGGCWDRMPVAGTRRAPNKHRLSPPPHPASGPRTVPCRPRQSWGPAPALCPGSRASPPCPARSAVAHRTGGGADRHHEATREGPGPTAARLLPAAVHAGPRWVPSRTC